MPIMYEETVQAMVDLANRLAQAEATARQLQKENIELRDKLEAYEGQKAKPSIKQRID